MPLKRIWSALAALAFFSISSFAQGGTPGVSAEELVTTALQRNQRYLAAQERAQEAEALARQAGLRPTPTLEVETASGAILGSAGESEYSAAYFHTIETGGKRAKRIAVAEKGISLAQAEVRELERQLAFEIKTRFIAAAAEELKRTTIQASQPIIEENYRLTVSRVSLGDAAPLEQQLLLAEMNSAEARLMLLGANSAAALLELKSAIGLPSTDVVSINPGFRVAEANLTLVQLQDMALRQRGDLQTLMVLEEQAAAEVGLAQSDGRPDITASGRYTRSHGSFDQSGFSDSGVIEPLRDTDNIVAFGVSIPLFTRRRAQASTDAAESRQIQRRLEREYLMRSIPLEVEAAYRRWDGATRVMGILRTGVIEPSQKNLVVIREAYRLGQLQLLDVLNEQRRLVDLQLSFVEAQAEAARALAALELAVGGNL